MLLPCIDTQKERLFEIPENRGMTIQNPVASTDNFYITTTVSIPNLGWVVCFWAKLEIQPTTTTIISMSSEGNCGNILAHTLA